MFLDAVEQTRRRLVTTVFDTTDRVQHMFYRYLDPTHPANVGQGHRASAKDAICAHLRAHGRAARQARRRRSTIPTPCVPRDVSDHGFTNFRRGVNLNTWLRDHGYLLPEGRRATSGDWFDERRLDAHARRSASASRACSSTARAARSRGIVAEGAEYRHAGAGAIAQRSRRSSIRRPASAACRRVAASRSSSTARTATTRPTCSSATRAATATVGVRDRLASPTSVFSDNTKSWSGDHCVDPAHRSGRASSATAPSRPRTPRAHRHPGLGDAALRPGRARQYMQGEMIFAEGGAPAPTVQGMLDPTTLVQTGAAPGARVFPLDGGARSQRQVAVRTRRPLLLRRRSRSRASRAQRRPAQAGRVRARHRRHGSGDPPAPDGRRARCPTSSALAARRQLPDRSAPSNPPQSPVAWSTFVTGMDPGRARHLRLRAPRPEDATTRSRSATPPSDERQSARSASSATSSRSGAARRAEHPRRHAVVGRARRSRRGRRGLPHAGQLPDAAVEGEGARRHGHGRHARRVRHVHARTPTRAVESARTRRATSSWSRSRTSTSTASPRPATRHPAWSARRVPSRARRRADRQPVPDAAASRSTSTRATDAVAGRGRRSRGGAARGRLVGLDAGELRRAPDGLLPLAGTVRFFAKSVRPRFEVYASPGEHLARAIPAQSRSRRPDDVRRGAVRGDRLLLHAGHAGGDRRAQGRRVQRRRLHAPGRARAGGRRAHARARARPLRARRHARSSTSRTSTCSATCSGGTAIPKYADAPPHPAFDAAARTRARARTSRSYYEATDRRSAACSSALPEGTLVIVMSDHGFQPYRGRSTSTAGCATTATSR